MDFKWPVNKVIHRLGLKFGSNDKWFLSIDIDSIKKRISEIDEEWNEIITKESITKEEKDELLSALKWYGFEQIVQTKSKENV